jgi:hypothetical protein
MHDLVSLIDDNDAMNTLADRLIVSARRGHAPATVCHRLMIELADLLARHLAREADFMFDEHDGWVFGRTIAAFTQQFGEFSTSWQAYLVRWTEAAIDADRKAYAGETMDLMTAFKLRLARENEVLYPLALERGRISYTQEP